MTQNASDYADALAAHVTDAAWAIGLSVLALVVALLWAAWVSRELSEPRQQIVTVRLAETIAAFIGEPVAISRGTSIPGDEYWPMIREICDRYGVVLICDEIITGFGRTGTMWAFEHYGVTPDLICIGKGVPSSLPLSGVIGKTEIMDSSPPGSMTMYSSKRAVPS